MSDVTRSGSSWWAPSSKHARRTAVGTTAIVLVLALITWLVWISPANPVSSAVHHALGVQTQQDKAANAKRLKIRLTAAQKQIWALEGQLKTVSTQSGSRSSTITNLKSQIADLQKQLGSAKAEAAANGSSQISGSGSGSGSRSGSGSGSSGSSGTHNATTVAHGSGKSTSATTPAIAVPTKAQVLAQTSRWYGLYTTQAPFNWAEYDDVSSQAGRATNMVGYFQGFDQDFNATPVQRSWANGRLPVMTWESLPAKTANNVSYIEGYTNADIINGKFDTYLTNYAKAVAANGMPMVIRLDHEMNGNWYNWSEGSKQQNAANSYKAMWQHVWQIFQNNGANQDVIWDWSPTRIDNLGNAKYQTLEHMKGYYPGAQYVDWVGMSGYYRDADDAPTFDKTFGSTLEQIRQVAPSKKILLGEIGATESGSSNNDAQKPKWFTSLFDALADSANSDVIGFIYFNETATTVVDGERVTNDWRINSRSDSLEAFKEGIARSDIDYDLQEVKQ